VRDAITFDLDGTLLHSAPDVLEALAQALEANGIPVPEPLPESIIGPPAQGMVERLGVACTPEQSRAVVAAFRRIYDAGPMTLTRPYPGAEALLRELAHRQKAVFVATNKPQAPTERLLARFFPGLIAGLCCIDSLEGRRLAKTEMLRELAGRFGLAAERAVMVGDGGGDLRAGRELGWATVAVAWGYGTREELDAERPDHRAESFPHLSEILERA
jgi:phosphoglycolate phosphatase